jgi:hypothetical protein
MKALRVFLYIIIGLAILFYITVTVSAPLRKVNELNRIATSDSVFMKKSKAIAKYDGLLPLVKEKAYREAQVILAQQDSIGLIINFRNSTASLMLKGVEIQASKIVDYKRDKIFDGINAPAFRKLFSRPLHNTHDFSTFVKEPIVIKKAPKDTIEAMKMATLPVLLPIDPAYVSYDLDRGIKLIMIQDSIKTEDEKILEKHFKSDLRKQIYSDIYSSFSDLKKPKYTPTVILRLSGKDVRSIYRALPVKASFVMIF